MTPIAEGGADAHRTAHDRRPQEQVAVCVAVHHSGADHLVVAHFLVRVAKRVGSQGCVTLPIGKSDVSFTPSVVAPRVPDPKTTPWPMGDALPQEPPPAGIAPDYSAQLTFVRLHLG